MPLTIDTFQYSVIIDDAVPLVAQTESWCGNDGIIRREVMRPDQLYALAHRLRPFGLEFPDDLLGDLRGGTYTAQLCHDIVAWARAVDSGELPRPSNSSVKVTRGELARCGRIDAYGRYLDEGGGRFRPSRARRRR